MVAPDGRHRARPDLRGADRTGALGHGVQAGRLHADGDLDAGRRHHLPAGVRAGPGRGVSPTRSRWACTTRSPSRRRSRRRTRPRSQPLKAGRRRLVHHAGRRCTPGTPVAAPAGRRRARQDARATPKNAEAAAGRSGEGHRHGLAGLHPRQGRRQAERRSTRPSSALDGHEGRGGQGRQGGRLRRRPARTAPSRLPGAGRRGPTPAPGVATSASRTTASTGSARRWSRPAIIGVVRVDVGRVRDGADRGRAGGRAARTPGGGPGGRRQRVAGVPPGHGAAAGARARGRRSSR